MSFCAANNPTPAAHHAEELLCMDNGTPGEIVLGNDADVRYDMTGSGTSAGLRGSDMSGNCALHGSRLPHTDLTRSRRWPPV